MRQKVYCLLSGLAGLLIGWLALGWWLWPVAYVGEANTYELNQADKLRYASAVVDSYAATGQADPAWFSGWYADEIQQTLEQVAQHRPDKGNQARMLEELALQQTGNTYVQSPSGHVLQVKTQDQASEVIPTWLVYPVVVVALLGFGAGGWLLWRGRAVNPKQAHGFETAFVNQEPGFEWSANPHILPTVPGEFQGLREAVTSARTLAHASLIFGPDQPTDQHFPIDSQQEGEPSPGEFGVNQVDDQPAWDVWLFDKQALVTVTKVLGDEEGKSEGIESRGDFIGWGPILLETPSLKMTGKTSDLHVMHGAPSTRGFTVDLTVEAKDAE